MCVCICPVCFTHTYTFVTKLKVWGTGAQGGTQLYSPLNTLLAYLYMLLN